MEAFDSELGSGSLKICRRMDLAFVVLVYFKKEGLERLELPIHLAKFRVFS